MDNRYLNDELFELEKAYADHKGSDMLMKNLLRNKLEFCRSAIGTVIPPQSETLEDLLGYFTLCGSPLRPTWALDFILLKPSSRQSLCEK